MAKPRCSSCINMRNDAKEEFKKGEIVKATLISLNGVMVFAGVKKMPEKYLDENKEG